MAMMAQPPALIVIGFCGLAGAGKSTAAACLVRRRGYIRLPFAAPLKAMALAFGLCPQDMEGVAKETPHAALCGRAPRQFLQALGTDFGRRLIGEDVWVGAWEREVARRRSLAHWGGRRAPLGIVADDVRFANEAAAIRRHFGKPAPIPVDRQYIG